MHQYLLDPPGTIVRLVQVEVIRSIEGPNDMARHFHYDQGSQFQWLAQLRSAPSHPSQSFSSRRARLPSDDHDIEIFAGWI